MASKVGSKLQGDLELDPKYEWQENAANFVLRLHLAGFRKEDFRVQVDGAGRLTIRGQRADGGKHVRFHKVFQLPPTSNLDDISGRFDAGVLSLTVPKKPAPPPATIDEIRKPVKQPDDAKPKEEKTPTTQAKPKEELINKKPKAEQHKSEETAKKKPTKEEEDARKKAAAEEKKIKEEEMQAKINKAAADEQMKAEAKQRSKAEQEHKPKPQAAVDQDSILERVRRRAEEERAKAEEAAERQKKQQIGWKDRVAEELQGLRTSEWAEGMVETVKKNKEVIAAAVAAFSLGLFVSSRLCNRN